MSSFGNDMKGFKDRSPKLGIIGGSGLCSFKELKIVSEVLPETKHGFPSDNISICEEGGQLIAFLPRHGKKHTIAPSNVPYRANIEALKKIGVEYIIGTCIVGSLKKEIIPGSIVLPDQFVNFTWGRDGCLETDKGSFVHLPMAEPYCSHLRQKIFETTNDATFPIVSKGTVVVIQGPRFSTMAESQWFLANGWDIVNMTQYPECYFAKEAGICYAAIAAVTDYDVGLNEELVIDPNKMKDVLEIFNLNIQKTKNMITSFIKQSHDDLDCQCASKTIEAYYEQSL